MAKTDAITPRSTPTPAPSILELIIQGPDAFHSRCTEFTDFLWEQMDGWHHARVDDELVRLNREAKARYAKESQPDEEPAEFGGEPPKRAVTEFLSEARDETKPDSPAQTAVIPESVRSQGADLTLREVWDFRDTFAALLSNSLTEPWDHAIASFGDYGGSDGDERYYLSGIQFPQCVKRVLTQDLRDYTRIVMVAIRRPGPPIVAPSDIIALGQILSGELEAEMPKGRTGKPQTCVVDLIDYIVVGDGGEWKSVPEQAGFKETAWCQDCLKYDYFKTSSNYTNYSSDEDREADEWEDHRYWCPRFKTVRDRHEAANAS